MLTLVSFKWTQKDLQFSFVEDIALLTHSSQKQKSRSDRYSKEDWQSWCDETHTFVCQHMKKTTNKIRPLNMLSHIENSKCDYYIYGRFFCHKSYNINRNTKRVKICWVVAKCNCSALIQLLPPQSSRPATYLDSLVNLDIYKNLTCL